jgi:hypothetical protein
MLALPLIFQQSLKAQSASTFVSQFVFAGKSCTMEISDANGNYSQVLLYASPGDAAGRDSFLVAGYNLSVFTNNFSGSLLQVVNAAPYSRNDSSAAVNVAMEQYMQFYNAKASAASTSPVAVTVFANEIVPTINKLAYRNYKIISRKNYPLKKKSLRKRMKANDPVLVKQVRGGDTIRTGSLTCTERRILMRDLVGSRPGTSKIRYSGLEAYLKTIANKQKGLQGYLHVDSISMEVMDGSIRNVEVRGTQYLIPADKVGDTITSVEIVNDSTLRINGSILQKSGEREDEYINNFGGTTLIVQHPIVYRSQFPIPISSMNNFGEINRVMLVQMFEPKTDWVLPLGLVMRLVPELGLNSDDYSPENRIYTIHPRGATSTQPSAILHKENTRDLFVARVYSDFVGVQSDQPNGLIQTEVSKKIIINPQNLTNTFVNFFEPRFCWSKIENKQKSIPSIVQVNGSDTTFSNTLENFRYSKFNFGTRVNFVRFDLPALKLSLFANTGAYIYQTAFSDTSTATDSVGTILRTVNQFNGTSFSWENEVEVWFHPDPRYGLGVSSTYRYMNLLSDRFDSGNKGLIGFQINGYYRPVPEMKNTMYFRAGIQLQANDFNQNFVQLQVGYCYNLSKD